jgi:hypothetical protein
MRERSQQREFEWRGDLTKFIMIRRLITYLFCLFIVVITSACSLFGVTTRDGIADWTFRVSIYDETTMAPIPGGVVRIVVENETPFGNIESPVQEEEPKGSITSSDGVCELTMRFNFYGYKRFGKWKDYINFRHRNLVVEAEGYQLLNLPLKTFIETPYELQRTEKLGQPSEIRVKLRRTPESDGNRKEWTKEEKRS